jgi:exopolysaccharide biosynthesis polyprenyl glycosylphosphotransferase
MFRRFSVNFTILSIIIDALLVSIGLQLATYLRPFLNTLPFTQKIDPPLYVPFPVYPIFSFIWVAILLLFAVYDGRKNIRIADELTSLTLGSILASVSLAGTLYLSFRDISRVLFLVFIAITFFSMLFWRFSIRFLFYLRDEAEHRRVLVIGAGPVGKELESTMIKYHTLGLKLVGYLDDNPLKLEGNKKILGGIAQAREIVLDNNIDDVVIALPRRAHEKVNHLVAELHRLPVKVWVIPDYFHLALHKARFEEFAGIPMLDLRAPALSDFQLLIKRAFDLIITIIALPPCLLIMGTIALAIRIEGRGTILFQQPRVGENGRIFKMFKFRTMVPDAEELRYLVERYDADGNLIHKNVYDPRITRVGRILRRTSLDELPQLLNILKGEMSLVGPRPEIPYLVEKYEPWQHKRFAVPQGLTGWWQVNGRSEKPMHLHTEEDLYYVQNYSLLLDIQILLKTVWVVLRRKVAF